MNTLERWLKELKDWSGFSRETAVRELPPEFEGRSLPILLERANDWVYQVRDLAQTRLQAMLTEAHRDSWLDAASAIERLQHGRRGEKAALLAAIDQFLFATPGARTAAAAALDRLDRSGRRWVFDRLLPQAVAAGDFAELAALIERGLRSNEIAVAGTALRAVAGLADRAARLAFSRQGLELPITELRAQCLRALCADGDAITVAELQRLALDRSASIRGIALFALDTSSRAALIPIALTRAADRGLSQHDRAAALQLLGTLDRSTGSAVALEWRSDASAAVRRAAFALVLSRTPASDGNDLLREILGDASPKVRRLAVEAVERGMAGPGIDDWRALLADAPQSLPQAVAMLRFGSPWTRLTVLLEQISISLERPPALHLGWLRCLDDLARVYHQPESVDTQRILVARAQALPRLAAREQGVLDDRLRMLGVAVPT